MILSGQELDTNVDLKQVYFARRKGVDLGDLQNGKLQAIAVDLLRAIDAAYLIYKDRLKAIGIATHEDLIACDPEELKQMAEELRDGLEVFFPILGPIRKEIQKATEDMLSQSGQMFGPVSESSAEPIGI